MRTGEVAKQVVGAKSKAGFLREFEEVLGQRAALP
jgi:hypothetical protein